MHTDCDLEVWMLRPLHVVRSDGTDVGVTEWRTGKTADLIRLLALGNGRPIRPEVLVARLWPKASPGRGRASLRTASSQIRRALQDHCLVRQPDGLVLHGAWVDVVEYLDTAKQVAVAVREHRYVEARSLAAAAEELYVDDFHAHDDDSDWAAAERYRLVRARVSLLCDAALIAQHLGIPREAAELATTATEVDPASETAHRLLMTAHADLGDNANALRVFDSYRTYLADELGADPSPQTQELHLRLLRGYSA